MKSLSVSCVPKEKEHIKEHHVCLCMYTVKQKHKSLLFKVYMSVLSISE